MTETTLKPESNKMAVRLIVGVAVLIAVLAVYAPLMMNVMSTNAMNASQNKRVEAVDDTYNVDVLSYDSGSMVIDKGGRMLKCAFPSDSSVALKLPLKHCSDTTVIKIE